MPPLANISGMQARRAFEYLGWVYQHHTGSHMILTRTGSRLNLSIPDHREIAPGLLRGLIRAAGISVEQFVALLHEQ